MVLFERSLVLASECHEAQQPSSDAPRWGIGWSDRFGAMDVT